MLKWAGLKQKSQQGTTHAVVQINLLVNPGTKLQGREEHQKNKHGGVSYATHQNCGGIRHQAEPYKASRTFKGRHEAPQTEPIPWALQWSAWGQGKLNLLTNVPFYSMSQRERGPQNAECRMQSTYIILMYRGHVQLRVVGDMLSFSKAVADIADYLIPA